MRRRAFRTSPRGAKPAVRLRGTQVKCSTRRSALSVARKQRCRSSLLTINPYIAVNALLQGPADNRRQNIFKIVERGALCRSVSLFAAFTSIEFTAGVCIIVFVNCFGGVLLWAKCFCLRINECGVDFGQIYYFFTLGLRQLFEFCSVSKGLFYIRYYEVGVFYHPMISF